MSPATQDLTATVAPGDAPPVAARLAEVERYALLEQIGAGAMGVVYAAYDATLDRKVALKLLPEHLLGGAHRDRLLREARALAQLSHPNVVPVYDVGETAGRVFFAMEFVRGKTVAAWASEPRSVDEILDVFRAAARGLAAAHAAGLVHRDVKPSNLLVGDDGRVRVADFGLANPGPALAHGSGETAAGPGVTTFAGSPAYMAPEQLRAEPADARSDQFALCVSLYEILHGRRPFAGDTPDALLAAMTTDLPAPTRAVPAWLAAAIARGLAFDPAARFADVTALVAALEPPRRSRWLAAGLAVALVGGTLAVVVLRDEAGTAPPRCDLEAAAIDPTWDANRRTTVTRNLERASGAEATTRITAQVDAYVAGWRAQREAACHAARVAHTWTADLEGRAAHCLEGRRGALDRTLTALATDGEVADAPRARAAIARLRSVRSCGDPDYLRSAIDVAVEPARRAPVASLDEAVEDLALAQILGRNDDVERTLPVLHARATALAYEPARAKLLIIEGEIARDRGELATAARLHVAAYVAARASRDPVPAAQAAVALVWDLGLVGEEVARAGDWAEIAAAESASLGDHEVGIGVHYALGALADRRGDLARALTEFERAAQLAERDYGPDHHISATTKVAVATVLGALGRAAEAIGPHLAAIAVIERWEGADARALIAALDNLALTESSAGLHPAAEEHARRALAIAEQVADPERLGSALMNLGTILTNANRPAEAIPLLDQAEARFVAAGLAGAAASSRIQRGIAATPAAVASREPSAIARVRADLDAGRAALVTAFGAEDLQVADADAALAHLLAQLGRCAEARPLLARATASYDANKAPTSQRRLAEAARVHCPAPP